MGRGRAPALNIKNITFILRPDRGKSKVRFGDHSSGPKQRNRVMGLSPAVTVKLWLEAGTKN